ncbi:MAG: response regulator [Chloroflexota bacterium]
MSTCVLMIEDDREMVILGKLILEREGYEFKATYDGLSGLDLLKENKDTVNLVLLDIMLPQMYGWEVLRQIKSSEDLKHIPVVMLTARHYLEDEVETSQYADLYSAYVVKPFVVRELLDTIANVLGDVKNDNGQID